MRTGSTICLAIGIILLIFSALSIIALGNAEGLSIGLGCAGFFALPHIVVGIVLLRRAIREAGPAAEAEASETFLRQTSAILAALGGPSVGKPRQQSWNWKGAALVLGLLAAAGGGILIYGRVNEYRINSATAPHQQLIEDVLSHPFPAATAQPPEGPRRLLVINTETRKVDWVFFDLPRSMQASTPDEVDLVVLLSWQKRVVSRYRNGKPGHQWVVRVRVLDLKGNAVVAETEVLGSTPPATISSTAPWGDGTYPKEQVVDLLITLFG